MINKKTALAAALAATLSAFNASASTDTVCSEVATQEQATVLMKRLFPDSKIISAEPLKVAVSTSCLLEVEMLTISNDPNSTGIVYVLPDGDHFLNGPLMSKRSWVGMNPLSPQPETDNPDVSPTASQMLSNAIPATTQTPAELRKQTLENLKKNPYLKFQFSENPAGTANVLFDIDCPYCIKQYQEMEAAAKEHNMNFNWIPVYLNERSWAAAALLMREAQKNPQAAKKLLDDLMGKKISNEALAKQYKTLTESDFALAKKTNMIFAEVVRQARVGTPLTFVENANGNVKVSSGKLEIEEWTVMLTD